MKNRYVLPTDTPSRLFLNKVNNKLLLEDIVNPNLKKVLPSGTYQNIYITSDEEIDQQTKPCWCINTIKNTWKDDLIYYQGSMPQYHYKGFKKIILTTDTKLIEEGVQAIDDEFLEWFVKNSSCEEVEVKSQHIDEFGNYIDDSFHSVTDSYLYKIIIPK
jgi:hypothetical protein